jgi:hypothetical protein
MDEEEFEMHIKIEFLKMYPSCHVANFNLFESIDLNCNKMDGINLVINV